MIVHALGDPTRRAILKSLTRHGRPISAVAKPYRAIREERLARSLEEGDS